MPRPGIGAGSRVTVIGLGYFGLSVATRCSELGYEVVAIDLDEQVIDKVKRQVALAVQGDGTDQNLLRSLQVDQSDAGIVAQGTNLEASIMTTMLLKKIGISYVVARAKNELHGEVLRSVGARRIVFPEQVAGNELAHSLAVPSIQEYISLTPTSGVAKIPAPHLMVGKTVSEVLNRADAKVSILLIRRASYLIATPSLNERIEPGDDLLVAGPDVEIERFMTPSSSEEE